MLPHLHPSFYYVTVYFIFSAYCWLSQTPLTFDKWLAIISQLWSSSYLKYILNIKYKFNLQERKLKHIQNQNGYGEVLVVDVDIVYLVNLLFLSIRQSTEHDDKTEAIFVYSDILISTWCLGWTVYSSRDQILYTYTT